MTTHRFRYRQGTASRWTFVNPILLSGEPGYETDTGREKIGDGVSTWTDLPYVPTQTDLEALSSSIGADLTNVDNTSDADKPVSIAQQAALDLKADIETVSDELALKVDLDDLQNHTVATTDIHGIADTSLIETTAGSTAKVADEAAARDAAIAIAVANLINSAPYALDTLNELATAIGDDPNFAATITNSLAGKQPINSNLTAISALTTTSYGRALLELASQAALKNSVGLANVDNTSDSAKPVSIAQQDALDLKIPLTQKGAASGVAPLDSGSRVAEANLPANLAASALSATYAGLAGARFTALPEVKGASEAKVLYNPGGVNNAGWQVSLLGNGRVFHLTLEDATATGALIACGLDFGNANYPVGILLANKAQSRGMTVDQLSTVTDSAAYGLYVRQASANAPASQFEVQTAGAAPAMQLSALNASASQKLIAYRSNTGAGTTEECGIVRADNGWLLWNKVIRPGQYTTSGRTAISGLGSSTRGSAVYNTDKQQPEVFTDLGWRSLAYSRPVATKTANYNMALGDGVIVSNGTGLTISLPDPTTVINDGAIFTVKNINAFPATVNSQGTSKTIDGAASDSLAQWAAGRYVSDGTQWFKV